MGGTYEAQNPELYWELNTNRLRFADYTPFHQALGQILSAVRQGFFGQDFMVNTVEGAKTALTNETAAMTLNKIGFARSVMKADPESGASSWGMFPIPWLNNNQVSIERSAPAWFGSATSHDKPAVLDLFRFLTRPDMLHRYALGQPEGTSLSFVGEPQPLLPNEDSFFQTARFVGEPFQGGVKYIMGQWMEIEADFETMLESGMSPQQFLERVDERRSNLAVSTGDPNWAKKASINPPL
jgi:ABC-type glycerol-3-phosphate transport system substrate-binding protein